MAPSSAQTGTSSSAPLPSSSSLPPANAHTPLEFCELLRAYWEDRSKGSLVPVPTEDPFKKKKNKGKGRAISTVQSAASDNADGQQPQLQRKRLIREAKSFYIKVDLAASPSCVKHINLLQSDASLREKVEKLVSLAQTSSSSTTTAPTPRKDSGNITPSLSGSPAKLNFRNAQQLLHAEARAETLERRVYLRVLLSRTIIRYVEKHTGCKYLYEGDKVVHYKEKTNAYSRKKKAKCIFYYQCASGEYEEPVCGGTMRLVVDLDLGDVLIHNKDDQSDDQHEENGMSLDESEPSDVEEQPAQKPFKTRQNGSLPRTPVARTYGSRSRYSSLLSSISLSSRSTRLSSGTARASAAHPSTSLLSSTSTLPPFVVALRLTHVKRHQEPYAILRAKCKESRLQGQAKLGQIEQKMILLQEEFQRLRRLQEDKDDLYERGVDKLWNKVKRAITPSDSEESDEDDTSAAEGQSVADGEIAVDQEDDAQTSENTEMEEDSPNESSKEWTASEEEVIISKDTVRTRSKQDKINQETGENSSRIEEVSQVSKPIEFEPLPRTSRSAKVIAVRDVESISSSSEDEEVQQQSTTNPSRTLKSTAKVVREVKSTSPSNDETDYSEPEQPVSASAKRKRNSDKEAEVVRGAGRSKGAASGPSRGSARATRSRPTVIGGGGRGRRGK